MEIRHNTKLLEEAVALVVRQSAIPILAAEAAAAEAESKANERLARASGYKRLSTAGAIALVLLAIGISLSIYNWRDQLGFTRLPTERTASQKSDDAEPKVNAEKDLSRIDEIDGSEVTAPPPQPPGIETRNYTIFQTKEIAVEGSTFSIEAGHQFATEQDQAAGNWGGAWCYSNVKQGSLDLKINLGVRPTPQSDPQGPITVSSDVKATGLSNSDILLMASNCPWLDGRRFEVPQLRPLQPEDSTSITRDGDILRVSGPITDGLAEKLRDVQFSKLEIDSEGGSVDEALLVGRLLRGRNVNVEVKGKCLSACVFVLAGGSKRSADPAAQIGVHRFSKDGPPSATDVELAQQKSSEIYGYLDVMGVSPGLWLRMSSTSSKDIDVIDHDQLRGWNLLSSLPENIPEEPELDRTGKGDIAESGQNESVKNDTIIKPMGEEQANLLSFRNLGEVDSPGYDLPDMPSRDVSEAECVKLCLGDKICRALTYNSSKRACFLKTKTGPTIPFKGAVTYSRN